MKSKIIYLEESPGVLNIAINLGMKTRYIGKLYLTSGVFECRKNRRKHLLKKINSIGFNYSLMKSDKIKLVKLHLDNETLYITREYLQRVGEVLKFEKQGFELQIFVNMNHFSRTPAAANLQIINNLSLFPEVV